MELQLDLLVDGELPEAQRRILVRRMEELGSHAAVGWRELALRFIERQTEKETVSQLMAGGCLVPTELIAAAPRRTLWRFPSPAAGRALAAGLLVALVSATVTFYAVRSSSAVSPDFYAQLPAAALGGGDGAVEPVNVSVPVVPSGGTLQFPMVGNDAPSGEDVAQRSWVIQRDNEGRPIAIPVNTMIYQVH